MMPWWVRDFWLWKAGSVPVLLSMSSDPSLSLPLGDKVIKSSGVDREKRKEKETSISVEKKKTPVWY
jgi:hypothetical protein